jgi:hypothetical protein
MKDPYEEVWKNIIESFNAQSKAILWIAERTLSAKDFKEFVDEFAKKPKDDHDELLDFIRKKGW